MVPQITNRLSLFALGLWAVFGLGDGNWCFGQDAEPLPTRTGFSNPFETQPVNAPIIQSLPSENGNGQTEGMEAALFGESLTVEAVQLRLAELEKEEALDKTLKEALTEFYQQAIADLKEAAVQEAKSKEYSLKTQSVPEQIKEAAKKKEALGKPESVVIPQDLPLIQLQQELGLREESLGNVKKRLDEAVNALKNITAGRGEASKGRKAAQDRILELEQQLKTLPGNPDAPRKTQAERIQLRARWQLLRASLARQEKEDAWRQTRTELLPLERDIAALEAARLEGEVKTFREAVTKERQAELDRQKAQAEAQARRARTFKKYQSIAEHANKIVELAEHRQTTAARIPIAVKQLDRTTEKWKALEDSFEQSRERVAAAGSTMNVGTLLRLQQKKLPNLRELEQSIHARQDEIQTLQLYSYEINDRNKELANVTKATEDLVDGLDPVPSDEERAKLQAFVSELLETEKSHLDNLNADYNALLDQLWKLDKVEKQLIDVTTKYSQFISENVLWIRSDSPLWEQSLSDFREAFHWLLRPSDWANLLSVLGQDFWEYPGLWMFAIALLGLLFIEHRKMKLRIAEVAQTINKKSMTEFRPTLHVLRDTFFLALLWPAVLCWIGYRLSHSFEAPATVAAMGTALFGLGVILFPVELLRQSCRGNGLMAAHFAWPRAVVRLIRINLRWFTLFVPPLWLVSAFFHSAGSSAGNGHESLGRVCFVMALLFEAWFMHRVLRPSGPVFAMFVSDGKPTGLIGRLKYVFYSVGVLVPLTLASLAVIGYQYTAAQLITRYYATALLMLAVLILDAVIQRGLLVARRRIALAQLRQRREAAKAQAEAQQAQNDQTGAASPVVPMPGENEEERLDVSAMNEQTRHLVRSLIMVGMALCLWGIWVDVLPALAVLKKVKIHALTIERVIEEPVEKVATAGVNTPETSTPSADGETSTPPPETKERTIRVPITLADLLLSVIILILAIGAARNLPGMLEMVVLQRLPIDNAARYAITTLAQYGLMIFGISAAFYVVGIRWQNVQWLAAALMVGLGFGLQEIFANFFSGLIVLLERPVRVGDIVTVGDTTGIVSRIRMRATTITNWERKEMIIPNKDLITGTVLNWTLSDTVQRVLIEVGVAYGSNMDQATEVLYEVVKAHQQVLAEPPPLVTFCGFGDSTLNFEVRCFLPNAAVKLATTHELHLAIDKAFRSAKIEIAFPQRDLHIRSIEASLPAQPIPAPSEKEESNEKTLSKTA